MLMATICQAFGLPLEMPASVKRIDNLMVVTEGRQLLLPRPSWTDGAAYLPIEIKPLTPTDAENLFLNRFDKAVDVPIQDEVDRELRALVSEAFDGWLLCRAEAPKETPDWEVEGFASDNHFDCTITGLEDAPDLFLTCRLSRRLVG